MTRGAPRKHDPTIPAHIDQTKLPRGLYWDRSGNGRWYLIEDHPDGGPRRKKTVAGPRARLSELHDIIESRAGGSVRGTIDWLGEQFRDSTEFKALAKATQRDYRVHAQVMTDYPTRLGVNFGQLRVATLTPPVIQQLVEQIAKGKPESRPGAGDATAGRPSKANHVLRYLRRLFAWGVRHGGCTSNPATGVKQATEAGKHTMPGTDAFTAALVFARERGARIPHTRGSCPPYLAPAMEIAYACRLRGIEVTTLTDAHILDAGLQSNRRKGSRDNITAWTPRLRAAISEVQAIRQRVWQAKPGRVIPIRPADRALFVAQDGDPLLKSTFDSAWQRFMALAIGNDGPLEPEQRFSLHGLKHRGVTDTQGTRHEKKDASGHRTDAAFDLYDHELQVVRAAGVEHCKSAEFSGEFSGGKEKGTPKGA